MRKFFVFMLLAVFVLSFSVMTNAAQKTVMIDFESIGIPFSKDSSNDNPAYEGDNHSNFRLTYSGWDKEEEYLWLAHRAPSGDNYRHSWAYLGEHDMSKVISIEFSYVSDAKPISNYVSLTKDKEGTQKVATFHVTEATGGLANPITGNELEILDSEYNGPLYLFIEYDSGTKRMFTGNYIITIDDSVEEPETETLPPTEPETNAPTGDTALSIVVTCIIVIGLSVIFRRRVFTE